MVKFSDLSNGEINSNQPSSKKEEDAAQANSRLSFRKLAEQKKVLPTDKVVSEKKASDKDIKVISLHKEGRNYSGILETAEENNVDLIIIGAHGLGYVGDEYLGSTTVRVLRNTGCDILIARREFSGKNILVGLDGSPESQRALKKAIFLSKEDSPDDRPL